MADRTQSQQYQWFLSANRVMADRKRPHRRAGGVRESEPHPASVVSIGQAVYTPLGVGKWPIEHIENKGLAGFLAKQGWPIEHIENKELTVSIGQAFFLPADRNAEIGNLERIMTC